MIRWPTWRRILAGAGLAALLLAVGGAGLRVATLWRLKAAARKAVADCRYNEARDRIDALLKAEPGDAEAHYLKARVALGTSRLDDLAASMSQAEVLGHPPSELLVLRAIIAVRQGRHAEAEPILSRAFEAAQAPDPLVDEALARLYIETFEFALAEPVMARWLHEAPRDPKPYLWRVEIDRRKGDADAVIRDYREVLKRDPEQLDARRGLADELRATHRCAEAAQEYAAYLARKPDDPAGQFGAGRIALELGDETAALGYLNRVLQLDPKHAQAHQECGEIDLHHGEFAKALGHFDRAVETAPESVTVHHSRALVLARLGFEDRAKAERVTVERLRKEQLEVERFRQRLLQNPRDTALQCQAARWMFDHGHDREGVRWAEQAFRDQPGNPQASLLLADYYRRIGNAGLANFYRLQTSASPPQAGESPAP